MEHLSDPRAVTLRVSCPTEGLAHVTRVVFLNKTRYLVAGDAPQATRAESVAMASHCIKSGHQGLAFISHPMPVRGHGNRFRPGGLGPVPGHQQKEIFEVFPALQKQALETAKTLPKSTSTRKVNSDKKWLIEVDLRTDLDRPKLPVFE